MADSRADAKSEVKSRTGSSILVAVRTRRVCRDTYLFTWTAVAEMPMMFVDHE